MTQPLIDFPMELAERAYAHSQVPDKAAREREAFEAHMAEVRTKMAEIAATERQQHLLDQLMLSYRRCYVAELRNVLEIKIKQPNFTGPGGKLSPYGQADLAFRQMRRRALREMEVDIRAAEQPNARWVGQVGGEASPTRGLGA